MVSKVLKLNMLLKVEKPMDGLCTYDKIEKPGDCKLAIEHGINVGFRHIDTVSLHNYEKEVGEGINSKITEGVVTRDDLFVITKMWSDSYGEKDVVPALKKSLARLKLEYVDMYLMDLPVSDKKGQEVGYINTWKGMEEALRLGLTKGIGVNEFSQEQLDVLLKKCQVMPACNQFQIRPTITQCRLVEFCKRHSVMPVAQTPICLLLDNRTEITDIYKKVNIKVWEKLQAEKRAERLDALKYLIQNGIVVHPKKRRTKWFEDPDV